MYLKLWGFLATIEKFFIFCAFAVRLILVALDLAGIFLVGVVVSLVSGTVISPDSPLTRLLSTLRVLGFTEGYVAIATLSVMFFILKAILSVILTYLTTSYLGRLEARKATELFQKSIGSDIKSFDQTPTQDLLQGFTRSLNVIYSLAVNSASIIVGEITLLVAVCSYLAFVNLPTFLAIVAFFGTLGIVMHLTIGKTSSASASKAFKSHLETQGLLLGFVSNIRQAAFSPSSQSFLTAFSKTRSAAAKQNAIYLTITTLPRYITEVAVMLGVGYLILQRSNSSGLSSSEIAVFLAGIFRIVASMLPLQSNLAAIKSLGAEAEIAFKLMGTFGSGVRPDGLRRSRKNGDAVLEVENLDFKYSADSTNVIESANITVKSGEYVAIVGSSGQGKSTFADLILGLRSPTQGSIRVLGKNPSVSRSEDDFGVRYVPQDPFLIDGTLLENILLEISPTKLNSKLLDEVLELAQLSEFVESLENGLETILGSSGVQVSGGQRQRISLARALYRSPKLLILDEATSALDDATEKLVVDAIMNLRGKISIIAIAHRKSTIQLADSIYELKAGKLSKIS